MLYLLGQKNFHNGMLDLAQDYFERIQQNYPDSPYHRSAAGYLVQIKRKGQKKKKSALPEEETFKISEELPEESEQMDIYHFAFYGISEISNSLYQKFGRSYRPGEVVFHEGEPGKELFIILEGSVEVSREEQAFTCLTTGDIFGEVSLFDGKPRSNTVTAIEPLRVLALTDKPFSMIFQLHPSWTLQLIQGFATRIAHSYELLTRGAEPTESQNE